MENFRSSKLPTQFFINHIVTSNDPGYSKFIKKQCRKLPFICCTCTYEIITQEARVHTIILSVRIDQRINVQDRKTHF